MAAQRVTAISHQPLNKLAKNRSQWCTKLFEVANATLLHNNLVAQAVFRVAVTAEFT